MKIHLSIPWRIFVVFVLALGMAGIPDHSAQAVTCTVTTAADSDAGSLREKIADAACSTINFDSSLSAGTISLTSASLEITRDMTIDGSALATPVTIDGNNARGIFYVDSNVTVTLMRLRLFHGSTQDGGAIYTNYPSTLTVTNSTLENNTASNSGGAIYSNGNLTVTNSTLKNNTATTSGGGIYAVSGILTVLDSTLDTNHAGESGGGIFSGGLNATVTNTTLVGNSSDQNGGGIHVNGPFSMALTNSTLTANSALYGGGIRNAGVLQVTNSTLSGNGTSSPSGANIYTTGTSAWLWNTIIGAPGEGSCYGTIFDGGNNLDKRNSCGLIYSIVNTEPSLGPLQDNGGPTRTMALPASSPAVNAANNGNCPSKDQRGAARPSGQVCDIGAYEFQFVLYATPGGLTNKLCDSWAHACELSHALTNSIEGQEIWVKDGTYKPTAGTDRSATFAMKAYVSLYGGFAGTETTRSGRDPLANATILSGDIGTAGNASDNSYHVVTGASNATLDGFTITGGNASGSGYTTTASGGGMYNYGSSPTLKDITFSGNTAAWNGGGLYNYSGSNPKLTGVTFSSNTATIGYGGGMANWYSCSPELTNVTFSANTAGSIGGGMGNYSLSDATLTNVTFNGNSTGGSGGAMYNSSSTPTIRNSIFWGNTSGSGSQFVNDGSTPVVSDSVVQGGYVGGTNIITADPLLGTLGNYGGSTQTIPLQAGSSAIDTGTASFCPANDQRGVKRPQGAGCDIGAYEVKAFLYASPGGATTGSCASWATACELRYAMTVFAAGQEIWVAAGTYKPTSGEDRYATFQLKDGMELYGGFAGGETAREQRNPELHLTILSGEINLSSIEDNSCHVVTGASGAILDGFTITRGHAEATANYGTCIDKGGGMYNSGSSPSLNNVTFSENLALNNGGGMYNNSSSPTLTNVTFNSNSTISWGAGMANTSSSPILINVTFSANSALSYGGGMYNEDNSSPNLTNVTFNANSAGTQGGGMYNLSSNPILMNVTFSGNSAPAGSGGGMSSNNGSSPLVMDSIFWGNGSEFVQDGGGSASIYDSLIQGGCPPQGTATCNARILNLDPLLGALADNGGLTQTMALGDDSPAIDAWNDLTCALTDQRGVPRPQGSACDIGAFEYIEPTAVSLMDFTAQVEKKPLTGSGKAVILSWRTTSEVDNLGFNLYRAASLDGMRIKLNIGLIPTLVPPGSLFGAAYSYKDAGLLDGTLYYWLEVVDVHGGKSLTGPVLVKLVAGKVK